MGDLNGKRGRIQGSASIGGGEVEIVANVPSSELLRYAIDLRSMTGGRGRFSTRHSHYDPVPSHLVDKIVSSTKETEKGPLTLDSTGDSHRPSTANARDGRRVTSANPTDVARAGRRRGRRRVGPRLGGYDEESCDQSSGFCSVYWPST